MPETQDESLSCSSWCLSLLDILTLIEDKPCGIRNSSNGGYMNSVSQAAASSDYLIKELEKIRSSNSKSPRLNHLLDLLHGINESGYSNETILVNTELHERLVQSAHLNRTSEKDAFKWFVALINAIDDELNSTSSECIQIPLKIKLIHRFDELADSDEIKEHFGLSLELRGNYSSKPGVELEFLISQHFKPKILEDDDKAKSVKRFFYKEAPGILLLHILANRWDNRKSELVKQEYHIKYNKKMTLELDIVDEVNKAKIQRKTVEYLIRSVIYYASDNSSRHKVTYRNWNNEWYLINNRQVKQVEFRNLCPYILIFEKHCEQSSKILSCLPSGLENKSTTCYINAMIQAVASSDILIMQFNKLRDLSSQSSSLNYLLDLLHGMNETEDMSSNTKLLEHLIGAIHWNKTSEQDAFNLFSEIINGIHNEMKSILDEPFQMPLKVKLIHRFQGIEIPDSKQDHLGLSLGLCGTYSTKPGVTLEFLIYENFKPSTIDGDSSKLSQIHFYKNAPDILILHIQANKWDPVQGKMIKPEYHITYHEEMTLELDIVTDSCIEETRKDTVQYRIRAIVQHIGTISHGHYVTYRLWREKWYLMNDEQVEKIEFSEDICPYILIYERKSS